MYDGDFFGRGLTLELVDLVGAVVGEVEERPLAGSVEADAGIRSGLADLLAGGELGVLVGTSRPRLLRWETMGWIGVLK